jgi:hypothetical protein
MRTSLVVTVIAVSPVLPAAASAKGPDCALISGPGISGVRIDGDEEGGTRTPLGALATDAGFATQVFGHHPNDPTTNERPDGALGAHYRVVYSGPTPTGRRSIVADLYPFATPNPLTYMKPGQPFFNGMATHGGWHIAPRALKRTLVEAGFPGVPSGANGSHVWRWTGIAVLGSRHSFSRPASPLGAGRHLSRLHSARLVGCRRDRSFGFDVVRRSL